MLWDRRLNYACDAHLPYLSTGSSAYSANTPEKVVGDGPSALAPASHVAGAGVVSGSWFWPSLALPVVALW